MDWALRPHVSFAYCLLCIHFVGLAFCHCLYGPNLFLIYSTLFHFVVVVVVAVVVGIPLATLGRLQWFEKGR